MRRAHFEPRLSVARRASLTVHLELLSKPIARGVFQFADALAQQEISSYYTPSCKSCKPGCSREPPSSRDLKGALATTLATARGGSAACLPYRHPTKT